MDWETTQNYVRGMMSPSRYKHTLGVAKLSETLAEHYGLQADQARLAALLHDCVRGWSGSQLLKNAKDFAIVVTEVDRVQPDLLHGPVAAELVQRELGIDDAVVLEAIRWHTTGCVGMGDLAKVIYVADSLEPGREYPGVDHLRQEMTAGLERIYLAVLNHTLSYLLATDRLVHPESVLARNQALLRLHERTFQTTTFSI